MIVYQLAYRGAASPDRVAVACACHPVGVGDANHRRLLELEALDGIGALDLRLEVRLQDFDGYDLGHLSQLLVRSGWCFAVLIALKIGYATPQSVLGIIGEPIVVAAPRCDQMRLQRRSGSLWITGDDRIQNRTMLRDQRLY